MLYVTLNEGDYIVINENIRVHYEKPNGGRSFLLGVEAPKEIPIARGKLFENSIAKDSGEGEALALSEKMKQEFIDRRLRTGSRRAKRRWGEKEVKEVPAT